LIGSIRRECVDHIVVWGEGHLRWILRAYARYYNNIRTHRSLHKDAPAFRPIQRIGNITSQAILGGLHHRSDLGFRYTQRPVHPIRNRGLGNVDTDLEQLTMDLGSAPERILKTHSPDKVAHLFSDPRSTTERTRLPSPVSGEAHSVPTHNSFGPDDDYGIKNARKATIEPNEQGAVGPAQFQSTWRALSKYVQLMTQHQKFSVKPPSRLEAIAHHADEKEGDCDHQSALCSDSGIAATPADEVFGSGTAASELRCRCE